MATLPDLTKCEIPWICREFTKLAGKFSESPEKFPDHTRKFPDSGKLPELLTNISKLPGNILGSCLNILKTHP